MCSYPAPEHVRPPSRLSCRSVNKAIDEFSQTYLDPLRFLFTYICPQDTGAESVLFGVVPPASGTVTGGTQ